MRPLPDESLQGAMDSLREEFSGVFAPESIAACLQDSHRRLLPARVQAYLPLLAHRFARERLRAAARIQQPSADRVPLVLFVCTGNSGRSQMAAALLRAAAAGSVDVASAGTHPGDQVQPEVLAVLAEVGAATEEMFPKPLTDEIVGAADVVVTMGCGDSCPVLPGRHYLDWEVPDPAGADLDTVRMIRDSLSDRVALLLTELADVSART